MGIKKHCGWFSHPLGRGGGSVLIAGLLCTGALVTGRPSEAVVQILPDMTVVQRTTTLMDPAAIRADPTVQGILAAFDRAERALQRGIFKPDGVLCPCLQLPRVARRFCPSDLGRGLRALSRFVVHASLLGDEGGG